MARKKANDFWKEVKSLILNAINFTQIKLKLSDEINEEFLKTHLDGKSVSCVRRHELPINRWR